MTLQLRKKRRTIRLSILPTISLKRTAALCGFASLAALSLLASSNDAAAGSQLQWGRPQKVRTGSLRETPPAAPASRPARVVRDAQVVAAAWNDADAAEVELAAGRDHSVVVQRNRPVYDPFDEDDRLAQLPNDTYDDPFDEPVGESIPMPDFDEESADDMDATDDIDAAEQAIEDEIQRRQTAEEMMEDPVEEMLEPESIEAEPIEEMEPIEEIEPISPYEDDNPYEDNLDDEGLLQQTEDDDWRTPDPLELTPEELQQRSEEIERERRESEESCREELAEIESDTISSIDLSIRVEGNAGEDFPYECAFSSKQHEPRQWAQITYNWKAAAICHKPLYFEQVQLERYGHTWGPYMQPIVSGVHFFGSLPILPYKMGIRTPTECVYTLGYYRPGSCAPYMIDPVPFTWRAAMFQGATATGISFIVP